MKKRKGRRFANCMLYREGGKTRGHRFSLRSQEKKKERVVGKHVAPETGGKDGGVKRTRILLFPKGKKKEIRRMEAMLRELKQRDTTL